MTLLDLCRLLRRYIVLVIALPVVCAVACYGYFAVTATETVTYSAAARIVVSTHVQDVAGLAAAQARANTQDDVKVTSGADANTKTVTITVVSPDSEDSVALANSIAESVADEAMDFVPDNADDQFNARIEEATPEKATKTVTSGTDLKCVLVALLAGLFVAICIVVVIDMVKRPVKSVEGIQDAVELPVLEILPVADGGERLLANVRFASKKDDLRSVCVVPVGDGSADEQAIRALVEAAGAEGLSVHSNGDIADDVDLSIVRCESLLQGMRAAYVARRADAVLLVARQWDDSLVALESAVAELKLADANLVGIVFAKAK